MKLSTKTLALGERYELVDTIGRGAAAVVHKVRDRRDNSIKAAKLLLAEAASNDDTVRRFEDEFRVLRGLHHPSLPEVFDYGWTDDDSRFMVMEFVDGQRLDAYLLENPDDLWVILYQLCEVLSFIHSHNLLHQDIKPGNVLVKRTAAFGEEMPLVVLIDFGLTFRRDAEQQVSMVGTPEYMAPEIIVGESPLTRAVDYYSLGVSLYELIVGELPFKGSGQEVFDGHLNRDVKFGKEKVKYAELYPHIRGLMSKDKRARLESFEEFRNSVIGRMTGGIDELEKAYGLAHINSLGMIGKDEVWAELMEWLSRSFGKRREVDSDPADRSEKRIEESIRPKGRGADEFVDIQLSDLPTRSQDGGSSRGRLIDTVVLFGGPGCGKTFLLEALENELEARGVETLSIADDLVDTESGARSETERHATAWETIEAIAKHRAVVVLVDDYGTLNDGSRELVAYLSNRRRFAATTGLDSRIGFVIASRSANEVETMLAEHGADESQLAVFVRPLEQIDHAAIHDSFRGAIAGPRDSEQLAQFLAARGHSVSEISDGLRGALFRSTASYSGGRWRFQMDASDEQTGSSEYYGELLSDLTDIEQQVLYAVVCNYGHVTGSQIVSLLDLGSADVARAIERIESFGLVRSFRGTKEIRLSVQSEFVRRSLYPRIPQETRDALHNTMKSRLETELEAEGQNRTRRAELSEQLSLHFAGTQAFEEALRYDLHAMVSYMSIGDIYAVRRCADRGIDVCRRWVEHCGQLERPRLFSRYVVKKLVESEWRESNFHRVQSVIENEYVNRAEPVPASLVPRYARSLQATGALTRAEAVLRDCMSAMPRDSVPDLRLRVELALVHKQAGDFGSCLELLHGVAPHLSKLDDYYVCRTHLVYSICYESMGLHDEALAMADRTEALALSKGFAYEQAIVYQVRATVLFDGQELVRAKSAIAEGVRFAGKNRLLRHSGMFYFLASAVYFSAGEYDRCLAYLEKALLVAERLNDRQSVIVYLTRFSMIHHSLGQYGNALRYLDRANLVGVDDFDPLVHLVRLDIALDLGLSNTKALEATAKAHCNQSDGPYRWGYYLLLRGRYLELSRNFSGARSSYKAAKEAYAEAGIQDDYVIANTRLILLILRECEEGDVGGMIKEVEEAVSRVESDNVKALLGLVRLEQAFRGPMGETAIRRCAERCEDDRRIVSDSQTKLKMDRRLYTAWRLLQETEKASRAFGRFHRAVKMIVANLPDRASATAFLSQPVIADTIADYRAWRKV